MYDPRWDDAPERDDGRACVYDERDRTDHDPRDGLMHDLDLPRGEARELAVDREHHARAEWWGQLRAGGGRRVPRRARARTGK